MLERISIFTKKTDEGTVTLCVVEAYITPETFIMNTYNLSAKEVKRNTGDVYVVRNKAKNLFPLDSDYDVSKVNSEGSIKVWNYSPSPGVPGAYARWVGTEGGAEAGSAFIKDTLKRMLSGTHGSLANERKLSRDQLALGCELIRGDGPHIKKKGN